MRVPTRQRAAGLATAPARSGLRLTRRGRLCLVLAAAVLVALAFSAGRASATATAAGHPESAPTASVVARPGDTLWSIARAAVPRRDPRLTVELLLRLNSLADVAIVPGQRVIVPRPVDTPGERR